MNHLNSVLIEGETTGKPETAAAANGRATASFDIRTEKSTWNRAAKKIERSGSIFHIRAIGQLAKTCAARVARGVLVRVLGRLANEGPADGPWTTVILADHMEIPAGGRGILM